MSTDTKSESYVRREIPSSNVGDDLVIFDDRVGKYFGTGPVGADIWAMLDKPTTKEAIFTQLIGKYAVDETTCMEEVNLFIEQMIKADLIVVASDQ